MKLINRPLLTMVSVATLLVGCESLGTKKAEQNPAPLASHSNESPREEIPFRLNTQANRSYDSIWDRIRAGYGLPDISNAQIESQLRFYTSNKNYFSRVTQQSEPYLHYVVNEMQANDIPLELALLPFIESAYNPSAVSAGQNAGMWQLGSATGRNFGLKQTSWYDGRKDVVASTDAAIRLLKKLYAMFDNDWLLAVAAYNAGEGTIQKAIDKNKRAGKPTDFWSLPLMQTTQTYVPQLLALSKIVANPDRYDFKLYAIADTPYFVKINVESQINLAQAAQNTDLDVAQLKKLNAGFNGWLTDPSGPHQLLVPVADAAAFTLQLDSLPKLPSIKWQEHIVKKGDTLDVIAKKYGVNAASIKSTNNLKGTILAAGQRLQIPLSPATITSNPASTESTQTITGNEAPKVSNNNNYYIVKSGENLWSIARAQKTSVNALAQLNHLNAQAALKPGQKLILGSQLAAEESKSSRKITYTIKSGDTLSGIANTHNVSTKNILEWNNLKDESTIQPNQELVILVP